MDDGKLKAKLPHKDTSFFNNSQKATPYTTYNDTIKGGYHSIEDSVIIKEPSIISTKNNPQTVFLKHTTISPNNFYQI